MLQYVRNPKSTLSINLESTEMREKVCTKLRELSSSYCFTAMSGPAQLLLSKIFLPPLEQILGSTNRRAAGCVNAAAKLRQKL